MIDILRAITLWQPWASLWVSGEKPFETRSWSTSYRGPVAIHASAKPTRYGLYTVEEPNVLMEIMGALRDIGSIPYHPSLSGSLGYFVPKGEVLPLGASLGYGTLVDCHLIDEDFISRLTPRQLALGDFTPGRFAWELRDVIKLDKPVKMRGSQGLWTVHDEDQILLILKGA